jgi:putative ABC transport system ATP-binding protein
MISTKNITFSYNKDQNFIMPDLFCQAGSTILVTGNSGKGKTTYLHILAGMLQPNSGEILIDNINKVRTNGNKNCQNKS